MYTIDYLKTLHADYVEWNTDPGSMIMPEDTYNFDFVSKANDLKNFIEEASALLYDINSSEQENK